jgi:glycosyltransferase involved in cell wall biosynthesis
MKILFLLEIPGITVYHTESAVGGVCNAICMDLKQLGHEVYTENGVFDSSQCIKSLSKKNNETNKAMKKIKRVLLKTPIIKYYKKLRQDRALKLGLKQIEADALNIPIPDIIISWVGLKSSIGSNLKKNWGVPLISIYDNPLSEEFYTLHNFHPFRKKEVELNEKKILSDSDLIIVYSNVMIGSLNKKYPYLNNFTIQQFSIPGLMAENDSTSNLEETSFNVIYVGSFLPWHKIPTLIKVFYDIINKNSCKIMLHLVGNGMTFHEVKKIVLDLNLQDNIIFYGYMDGDDLKKLLCRMNLGIIPGCLWFHSPVKFMQYASAGIPIIAPKTPTLEEMKDGNESVYLFDDLEDINSFMIEIIKKDLDRKEREKEMRNFYLSKFSPLAKQRFWKDILVNFENKKLKNT